MKKLTKAIASTLVIASVLALNPIGASAEWKQNDNGWRYEEGDSWAKDGEISLGIGTILIYLDIWSKIEMLMAGI